MTCPSCANLMCNEAERYLCPRCKGELFTPTQHEGIDELWFKSKQRYPAAMRDEYKTHRYSIRADLLT